MVCFQRVRMITHGLVHATLAERAREGSHWPGCCPVEMTTLSPTHLPSAVCPPPMHIDTHEHVRSARACCSRCLLRGTLAPRVADEDGVCCVEEWRVRCVECVLPLQLPTHGEGIVPPDTRVAEKKTGLQTRVAQNIR